MSNIIQNNSNDRVCKTSPRPKNQLRFKSNYYFNQFDDRKIEEKVDENRSIICYDYKAVFWNGFFPLANLKHFYLSLKYIKLIMFRNFEIPLKTYCLSMFLR